MDTNDTAQCCVFRDSIQSKQRDRGNMSSSALDIFAVRSTISINIGNTKWFVNDVIRPQQHAQSEIVACPLRDPFGGKITRVGKAFAQTKALTLLLSH